MEIGVCVPGSRCPGGHPELPLGPYPGLLRRLVMKLPPRKFPVNTGAAPLPAE